MFGNNTYPRRIRCRSNLGHIFREKKCVLWAGKYGMFHWMHHWGCGNSSWKEMTRQHTDSKKKVKGSRDRPGVARMVPGDLGYQISMTFGTWRWWGHQPHALAAFTPRKCFWYSFSLGAELTPGPWYGRKEYVTEKSTDTTGNRSWDCPTSSAAP
jgi:hypothetical protein